MTPRFLARSAGERAAFGSDDRRLSAMDQALLMHAINDPHLLAYGDQRADELISKYRAAHSAVSELILAEIESGTVDIIPSDVVLDVAKRHGAPWGAEESRD